MIFKSVLLGCIASIILHTCVCDFLKDKSQQVSVNYEIGSTGINLEFFRDEKSRLRGTLGKNKSFKKVSCSDEFLCHQDEFGILKITPLTMGFNISYESNNTDLSIEDCYYLNSSNTHWYGGPQRYNQVYPVEKMQINGNEPYVIKKSDNFGVAERYWLNSNGTYIYLDEENPLWVDQNMDNSIDQVCFRSENLSPYINRWRVILTYVVYFFDNSKEAHLNAVNKYLGKPTTHPNEKMITEPIWTTWAKYKKPISDATVLEFGKDIHSHGYQGGQLEIDDAWETCYGAQEFDESKFSDIQNTVAKLHNDSWRVSLWVHPFVNDDCQNNSLVGQTNGYFVHNTTNQTMATWWNSNDLQAHQIDFTNPKAAAWWSDRLKKLQQSVGIDSFKFDGGESDYMNQPPVYADVERSPNILTEKYIDTCTTFGDLIEVRASFRGQRHGEFIRMLDKDSNWGLENGLATLITTLLQLNMNGYVMVLPDMIGGNGYLGQNPTGDLIVRWTQANTFMPAMQFSYLPWDYKNDVTYDIEAIVKKYVDLHAEYAPKIIEAMNKSIEDGSPVNAPIWWVDPNDLVARTVSDEYLLGEDILVAPVIIEGSVSRDIYLPSGQWKDGNNGTIFQGPTTLKEYPAPIEVLPYFIKQ
ncbi:myogenesis-regulating glycosidase-like [Anthonomus grandis grandis]|uniref:myogenesis-regulating glycosidase-like n=1 Tax=Anthonomus grandis grandis TaxID=2921223 RepID=UPI002166AE22|nr:myogenesis-regulating glycosidase-like [Anthonomus grandis grandis]